MPLWLATQASGKKTAMDVVQVPVLFNRPETPSVHRLGVAYDACSRGVRAAQFVMLALPDMEAHIIPRPFSVSDAWREGAGREVTEFLYKPVGRVTGRMRRLEPGDDLRIGGVQGNGFPDPARGRRPVLMAGGIGNAPFAYHVRSLIAAGHKPEEITLFLAGRSKDDIWIQGQVRESGIEIVEITDDGSRGRKGLITDVFSERLPDLGEVEVFACGPLPMLRAIQSLALGQDFPCHLSLEEHMACGYGVCNACVVESAEAGLPRGENPYIRLCIEGPVCEARTVHLAEELGAK